MSELTLYVDANYESPWALTAFVALEEKQLPYRLATMTLSKKETFGPGYGARTRKVPSLKRGDFWLAESMAIAEYVAESFPAPKHPRIFPENLEERATCREVQLWLRTDFMAIREQRPTSTIWFQRATQPLTAGAEDAIDRLIEGVEPLLAHGRPTLFAEWCIADVDLALMLQRLNLNGHALPPKLKAYAEANWARPSVAKWNALPRGKTAV
ncbi:MAG: glutathione transferase [Myxococcota bacterium]